MAIIAQHTAPNFATGNYHRILKAEILCGPKEPCPRFSIMVGFYASAEARDKNTDPMYVHSVGVPFTDGVDDPRPYLYGLLAMSDLFKDMDLSDDLTPPVPTGS